VNNRVTGILLMAGSMAVFTVLDSLGKSVMLHLPMFVAVFFRYAVALVLSLVVALRAGGPQLLTTRHPALQMLRGFLLLGSTWFNFVALSHLQLAQTAAIAFTIPLWVCALSVPMLGEKVGPWRWSAVVAGFLGVLVIMRPGTMSFHWAMLFSLASTLCGASYNIVTRKVGGQDRAETSLFYVGLAGSLGAALPLGWSWQTPEGWQWAMLVGLGLCGGIGHFMLIQAHRLAPAAVLAPFVYTQIVWMIVSGFVVFRDLPDFWTLVGAAIVIASGLIVFARERQLGRETSVPAPSD
jgi:drug/metabolite transporter (DMT)-like permease